MGGKGGSQEVTIGYKYSADVHLQASHGTSIIHRGFIAENCLWNYCPVFTEEPADYRIVGVAQFLPTYPYIPDGYHQRLSHSGILFTGYQSGVLDLPAAGGLPAGKAKYGGGPLYLSGDIKDDHPLYVQMGVVPSVPWDTSKNIPSMVKGSCTCKIGKFTFELVSHFPDGDSYGPVLDGWDVRVWEGRTKIVEVFQPFYDVGNGNHYFVLSVATLNEDGTRYISFSYVEDSLFPISTTHYEEMLPPHKARSISTMQGWVEQGVLYTKNFEKTGRIFEKDDPPYDPYYLEGYVTPQFPTTEQKSRHSRGSSYMYTSGLYQITSIKDPIPIEISKLNLFGGEEREGGVAGTAWLFAGHPDQHSCAPLLAAKKLTEDTAPLYRGVAGVFFSQFYWGTQPYIKGVTLTVGRTQHRTNGKSQWFRKFATWPAGHWSFGDMNPAHIIREAYTDTIWGLGVSEDLMGDTFTDVALQLYDEGIGLSLTWVSETPVEDFVGEVLRTIDAVLYQHPLTGKYEIKLIRPDYDKLTIPTLNPSNSRVLKMGTPSGAALINQITVKYKRRTNPCTGTVMDSEAAIVVQNPGAIMAAKRVINQTMEYPGISNDHNANRAALRDLSMLAQPLRTATIQTNRKNYDLLPGDVFLLNDPDNGIGGMVFRIGKRVESPLADGSITLECVQDLFDVRYSYYSAPPPPAWVVPDDTALNFPVAAIVEPPMGMLIRYYGSLYKAEQALEPGQYQALFLGDLPSSKHLGYRLVEGMVVPPDILTKADKTSNRMFAPAIKMVSDYDHIEDEFVIPDEYLVLMDLFVVGACYLVGTNVQGSTVLEPDTREIISIVSKTTNTVTVARGVWDTVPQPITAGMWMISMSHGLGMGGSTYNEAQVAGLIGLPATATDVYDETLDDPYYLLKLQINGRRDHPYPPGDVRLNGSYDPLRFQVAGSEDLTIQWARREIEVLDDTAVSHYSPLDFAAPGSTTTYTVKWKGDDEAVWHEESGLTTNTFTLTHVYEKTERNMLSGAPTSRLIFPGMSTVQTLAPTLRIMVVAVKNGVESLNPKIFEVRRIGYGYNMGIYYGGYL